MYQKINCSRYCNCYFSYGLSQLILGNGSLMSSKDGVHYVNSWEFRSQTSHFRDCKFSTSVSRRFSTDMKVKKRHTNHASVFSPEELGWCKPLASVPRTSSGIIVYLVESAEGYLFLRHRWEKGFRRTWMGGWRPFKGFVL